MQWIKNWVATLPSPRHAERNEDNFWLAEDDCAAAVIDGMGGYRRETATAVVGGEHASALAAQVLAEELNQWNQSIPFEEAKKLLRDAIEAVNTRIWEQLNWSGEIPAEENSEGKDLDELTVGVAMTLIALCDNGTRAIAAQHGDTHGYVLKEMGLIQITEDQDLLLWECMNGLITDEEAAEITEAIDNFDGADLAGMPPQRIMRYFFDKNIFGALGVDAECAKTGWSVIKLDPNDRLALLSDGPYSNMSINVLAGLLGYPDDPATVVIELASQRCLLPRFPNPQDASQPFNMRATQDDMTVIVIEIGEEGE
jgi:serine/threonine protein phosphatase PrpC